MIAIAGVIAFCLAFIAFALWADKTGFDPFARLYGTDPRELVERAQTPRAQIDWSRMHHGICPKCREDKFIGHGPLCIDCYLDGAA